MEEQKIIFEPLKYHYILGPCSAESKKQVFCIAAALMNRLGHDVQFAYRAGVWKPRTKPGGFEGIGEMALSWLETSIQSGLGLDAAVEVANREQTLLALEHGIRILWIGARTTCDPFAVQEIAETIRNSKYLDDVHVLVKNPISPDEALWEGAILRFYSVGIKKLSAVFRGFSHYGSTRKYRNNPIWSVPMRLKMKYPSLQIYCDPSHIAGNKEYVYEIIDRALDYGFEDFMIEVHNNPEEAFTDAKQQITPGDVKNVIDLRIGAFKKFKERNPEGSNGYVAYKLASKRQYIDEIDDRIVDLIKERLEICKEIGAFKNQYKITLFQEKRAEEKTEKFKQLAKKAGLSEDFILKFWDIVHQESLRIQQE